MIQRLTSQIQELQERMNCLSDSREYHEEEPNYSGNFFTRFQSTSKDSKSTIYAKLRQTLASWQMESVWITGKTFLSIHVPSSSHHKHLIKEFFTPRHRVLQVRFQCMSVQGELLQEVKNELETRLQCRCLQEGRQP